MDHPEPVRVGACLPLSGIGSRELLSSRSGGRARPRYRAGPHLVWHAPSPGISSALRLIPGGWGEGWQLRPSPPRRHWMDELPHAYKCLPLVIANQWGWQILCPTDVIVTWDGDPNLSGLHIDVAPQYLPAIKSQFGAGIITFSPPWLFRTPQGWDLYLKGPSNRWKPNCVPLEGVIETWWLNYTFTMNWKLVEPGTVYFARGESLGHLVPVPHATFRDLHGTRKHRSGALEPARCTGALGMARTTGALVAGQKVNVHQLYRKAEGIEEHIQSVDVPPIEPWDRPVPWRIRLMEPVPLVETPLDGRISPWPQSPAEVLAVASTSKKPARTIAAY